MQNLRLVFNNIEGIRKDITLPIKKWADDWWGECEFVPSNDTVILIAELDGKSILHEIEAVDERYVNFEEVARHLGFDGF